MEKRLGGGFQFRTWLVSRGNKHFIAKITGKPELALKELMAYVYLKNRGYEDRYYSELLDFDVKAEVKRRNAPVGSFYALLLKKYEMSLDQFLSKHISSKRAIGKKIAGKLSRRVKRLHALKIIHGDLHERNILLRVLKAERVGVLLTDFGSSKLFSHLPTRRARKREVEKENRRLEKLMQKLR